MIALQDIPQFVQPFKKPTVSNLAIDDALRAGLGTLDIHERLKAGMTRVYERRAVLIERGELNEDSAPRRTSRVKVGDKFLLITNGSVNKYVTVDNVGRKYFTVTGIRYSESRFLISTRKAVECGRSSHILVKMVD